MESSSSTELEHNIYDNRLARVCIVSRLVSFTDTIHHKGGRVRVQERDFGGFGSELRIIILWSY